jgi:hypothetical protein
MEGSGYYGIWSLRKGRKSRQLGYNLDSVSRLIFDPEDGGDTFLRNVGSHRTRRRDIPEDGNIQLVEWRLMGCYVVWLL